MDGPTITTEERWTAGGGRTQWLLVSRILAGDRPWQTPRSIQRASYAPAHRSYQALEATWQGRVCDQALRRRLG